MKKSRNVLIHVDTNDVFTDEEKAALESREITVALINEIGPGGGNPEYAFIGQPADLIKWMLENSYAIDKKELLDMYPELGPNF